MSHVQHRSVLRREDLQLAAVIGPMQQGLTLARPAHRVAGFAVALDLADMAAHRPPPLDLPRILLRQPTAEIVAAIPLEPAARVVRKNPSFVPPYRQLLAGIDPEIIERTIAPARGQLRVDKPS